MDLTHINFPVKIYGNGPNESKGKSRKNLPRKEEKTVWFR